MLRPLGFVALACFVLFGVACGDGDAGTPATCDDDCFGAPTSICDGDTRVDFNAIGECVSGECVFERRATTPCPHGCADGVCLDAVDLCEDVVCDVPPAPRCEGNVAHTTSTGVCDAGTCAFDTTQVDCAADGRVCVDGTCRRPGPCEAVACDEPPQDTCAGPTRAIVYGADGDCDGDPPMCTYPSEEIDCSADGLICVGGACVESPPCDGASCDALPQPRCDGVVAVTFSDGRCDVDTDTCVSTESRESCAEQGLVCEAGRCVSDPRCAGVLCTTPPADRCAGSRAVRYEATGTCDDGECTYEPETESCADAGLSCQDAACVDSACLGVVCASRPSNSCDGDVAIRYEGLGTCTGGACTYTPVSTDCAEDGRRCQGGSCVSPPACEDGACTDPPPAYCDGDLRRRPFGTGVCADSSCTYTEETTDCAALGGTCTGGECRDACDTITCDTPPSAACSGNNAIGFDPTGVCAGGACTYTQRPVNCSALGQVCIDGACVADPCDTLVCDSPPPAYCDGDVLAAPFGEGVCADTACTYLESRTDCTTSGRTCIDAGCRDACYGVTCDVPPADYCDEDQRFYYASAGECQAGTGGCVYPLLSQDCTATGDVCVAGACVPDPCDEISCGAPPAMFCDGDFEVEPFGAGVCLRGTCTFAERRRSCVGEGLTCQDGACRDACYGVACTEPPEAVCSDDILLRRAEIGVCELPGATCAYAITPVNCTLTDELCIDDACVPDPCLTTSCEVPPEPFCDGNVEVETLGAGECDRGTCTYPERRRDCDADGLTCIDGACRDACYQVACESPPDDVCDDDTLVVYAPIGTCSAATGTCAYGASPVSCTETNEICLDGLCVLDPCDTLSCDTPPAQFCDGQVEVEATGSGVCNRGACSFPERRRDCALEGLSCLDDACRDACYLQDCSTPPSDFCDEGNAITYVGAGVCTLPGGVCDFAFEIENCEADGRRCVDGRCEVDPCNGVTCNTPPAATCEGDVAVFFAPAGVCGPLDGACVYARAETNCAASDLACFGGICVDACFGVTCDAPPPPTCIGNDLVTFSGDGACDVFSGTCVFDNDSVACAATGDRCVDGACEPDPCFGVACDDPPSPYCDGDISVRLFGGSCEESGVCVFQESLTNCAAFGFSCDDGACTSPCDGLACDTPPADVCVDGFTRVTYDADGVCDDETFVCRYEPTFDNCAAAGLVCEDGTCVVFDPCVGVLCDDEVPQAFCLQGDEALVITPTGLCENGACAFDEVYTQCDDFDQFCVAGFCVDDDPCEGVVCDDPPAGYCIGDVAVGHLGGRCSEGSCVYDEFATRCNLSGAVCVDGACEGAPPCECGDGPPEPVCANSATLIVFQQRCDATGACIVDEFQLICANVGSGFVCIDGSCQ